MKKQTWVERHQHMDELHARLIEAISQEPNSEKVIAELNLMNEQRRSLDRTMDSIDRRGMWLRWTFWPVIIFVAVVFFFLARNICNRACP